MMGSSFRLGGSRGKGVSTGHNEALALGGPDASTEEDSLSVWEQSSFSGGCRRRAKVALSGGEGRTLAQRLLRKRKSMYPAVRPLPPSAPLPNVAIGADSCASPAAFQRQWMFREGCRDVTTWSGQPSLGSRCSHHACTCAPDGRCWFLDLFHDRNFRR